MVAWRVRSSCSSSRAPPSPAARRRPHLRSSTSSGPTPLRHRVTWARRTPARRTPVRRTPVPDTTALRMRCARRSRCVHRTPCVRRARPSRNSARSGLLPPRDVRRIRRPRPSNRSSARSGRRTRDRELTSHTAAFPLPDDRKSRNASGYSDSQTYCAATVQSESYQPWLAPRSMSAQSRVDVVAAGCVPTYQSA